MSAVWMRVRAELRGRWRASVGLALVVGLAGGLVIAAAAGARRTDSAYTRFLAKARPAQVFIPLAGQFFGFADVDLEKVEALPQVAESARFTFYVAFIRTASGLELTPMTGHNETVSFASDDPRYDRAFNRTFALEGRLPDPNRADEAAVSYDASQRYRIHIGDTLTYRLLTFQDFAVGVGAGIPKLTGPVVPVRIVGIEVTPGELPPGLGFPVIHLTRAFHRTYGGKVAAIPAINVRLKHDRDFAAFQRDLEAKALAPGQEGRPVQLFSEPSHRRLVQRSIHVQAVALWTLALLAGLASLAVFAQAIARQAFAESDDNPVLRSLGMTRSQVFTVGLTRSLAVGVAGAVVSVAIAFALSPLTPIGLARVAELHRGLAADAVALGVGAVGLVATVAALGALAAWRAARALARERPAAASTSRVAEGAARAGLPASLVAGIRLALEPGRGRTAVPMRTTLIGIVIALLSVGSAVTFAASLTHLSDTPRLQGWNWDLAIGDSFDPDTSARVLPVLRRNPTVSAIAAGGSGFFRVGGESVEIVGMDPVTGVVEPTMLQGRPPRSIDEVALGTRTMRAAHVELGDVVRVSRGTASVPMRVVGRIVTSNPGSGELGTGAVMTFAAFKRVTPTAPVDQYLVRFAVGADRAALIASIRKAFPDLGVLAGPRIGDVQNVLRVRNLPLVLAGLLSVMGLATMVHTLVTVVRRRRLDLAILKTLGFATRQLRSTVAVQATTLALIALAVGLPLGAAAGRWSWRVFADQLGVAPEPVIPLLPIVLAIPGTLVLANLIAAGPSRAAARTRPAVVLRSE
jgi:putative ABC transport system permease protein